MSPFKVFCAAATAAITIAGLSPAYAQTRDTRPDPEPDRPRIETNNSGRGDAGSAETAPRLPKASPGIDCILDDDSAHNLEATVVNKTGKTLSAGTILTLYVQPDNIQKLFKLETNWLPNMALSVPLKGAGIQLPAFCAVKVSTARTEAEPPAGVNDPGLPAGPGTPGGAASENNDDNLNKLLFMPGDKVKTSFSCMVVYDEQTGHYLMQFTNTGNVTLPEGTHILYSYPDGYTYASWYISQAIPPGETLVVDLTEWGDDKPALGPCTSEKVDLTDVDAH